jgi:hypothetical protein
LLDNINIFIDHNQDNARFIIISIEKINCT